MRAFRLVGFLLLILLFGWIGCTVLFQTGYQKPPTFLGLGSAFEGSLQLPVEKIIAAFEAARSRMLAVNDRGTEFRIVGDVAGWLSFAATAAITLIVGFYGRPVPAAGAAPDT